MFVCVFLTEPELTLEVFLSVELVMQTKLYDIFK